MKTNLLAAIVVLAAASTVRAQAPAQAQAAPSFSFCGTYGAYVMLYKNTDQFEELGKLRCGEKVEVLGKWFDYLQIRTLDGKVGWARSADVTGGPASTPTATPFGLTNSPVQTPQHEAAVPLNDKNIISMQAMRLSPEVIIAKIQSSPTSFDTSASGLQKLKYAGVPDKVIVAMVQASAIPAAAPAVTEAPKPSGVLQIRVPDGTPVDLTTISTLSSDDVREGMTIHLKVLNDVTIDGVTILRKDSDARARVYVITQPTFISKVGEVEWAMEDIAAINGDLVPATFAPLEPHSATASDIAAADTGTTWQFRKNKPSTMPAGRRLRATIHGDIVLKVPAAPAAQADATRNLSVSISTASATNSQNLEASPEVSSSRPTRTNPR
jgi:uncharacterized protein YgiM (DUF1202 family)